MSILPISRKDESLFPEFNSHSEAASYFKERFGSDFIFKCVEPIGDMNCYFYVVVVDHEAYRRGNKLLSQGIPVSGELGIKYLMSHQPIQIMENGSVHVVH